MNGTDWYYAQLLADYLGIDVEDVEQSDYDYNVLTANVDGEEQKYYVGTYSEMKQLAIDSFCELYDEIGEQLLNDRSIKPYIYYDIDEDGLREWYINDTEDYLYGLDKDSLIEEFDEYGFDVDSDTAEDYIPELAESIVDSVPDIIEELEFQLGEDGFKKVIEYENLFDVSEVADRVIDMYGIENELAPYDGKEIELGEYDGEDIYAYRIN